MTRPSVVRAFKRQIRDAVLNSVIASSLFPRGFRWRALSVAGLDVQRSTINGNIFLGGSNIRIGRDVFINYGAFIDAAAPVEIGERVSFGPRVMILTGSHEIGSRERRAGFMDAQPVKIGPGAWIGAGAIVLPGVSIGAGAVVAAGAIVTEDVAADTLVAGVPARVIRSLD